VNDPRYADAATRLLAQQRAAGGPESLGDRAATVAALERALRGRGRARTLRRTAIGLGAAAAAVLAIAVGQRLARGPVAPAGLAHAPAPAVTVLASARGTGATLLREGLALPLVPNGALRAGDRLRTSTSAAANVTVSLSTGTRLGLPGAGELELTELGAIQRFTLRTGRVRADVAKLAPGQRFVVVTRDSEIEVRGTSFEASVEAQPACPGGTTTRVRVLEGVVTVRHAGGEDAVRAGSAWRAACDTDAPPAAAAVMPQPRVVRRGVAAVEQIESGAGVAPPLSSSTLAAQNELFAAALAARRDGDLPAARQRLDELLTRFPFGPLAESARAERRRLTSRAGERAP
jgi:hypothetical protein